MKIFTIWKKLMFHPLMLLLIIILTIYATYVSDRKQEKISKGLKMEVCQSCEVKNVTALRRIIKENDLQNYLSYTRGFSEEYSFMGRILPKGQKVIVTDTSEISKDLLKIYIHRENPTLANPRNEYLWIWEGYLCKR